MASMYQNLEMCRICCRTNESLSQIFIQGIELDNLITKHLPVVVLPWDPFPHKICQSCLKILQDFNNLYKQSLNTDSYFRKILPSQKQQTVADDNAMVKISNFLFDLKKQLQSADPEPAPTEPLERNETTEPIEWGNNGNFADVADDDTDSVYVVETVSRADEVPVEKENLNTLPGFIINNITMSECIYTCRECFRTYTKKVSALSHSCANSNGKKGYRGPETETGKNENMKKVAVSKMNARPVDNSFDEFVCYRCQSVFNSPDEINKHIQLHHSSGTDRKRKRKRDKTKKGERKKPTTVEEITGVLFHRKIAREGLLQDPSKGYRKTNQNEVLDSWGPITFADKTL